MCTGPVLGSVLMMIALVLKRWSARVRTWLGPRMLRLGRWTNCRHAIISGTLSLVLGAGISNILVVIVVLAGAFRLHAAAPAPAPTPRQPDHPASRQGRTRQP